jgi:hypothetical protein
LEGARAITSPLIDRAKGFFTLPSNIERKIYRRKDGNGKMKKKDKRMGADYAEGERKEGIADNQNLPILNYKVNEANELSRIYAWAIRRCWAWD